MNTAAIYRKLRFQMLTGFRNTNATNNSNVVVFREASLAYNRVHKAGNTSVILFLDELLNGAPDPTYRSRDEAVRQALRRTCKPLDLGIRDQYRLKRGTRFAVVRNPLDRCLSMFLQKRTRSSARYARIPGFDIGGPIGFERFVTYLESGGISDNPHWRPQVDLLFWPPEDLSYVIHLENLDAGLRRVASELGVCVPPGLDFSRPHEVEISSTGRVTCSSMKRKTFYNDSLLKRVARLYSRDFLAFDYPVP